MKKRIICVMMVIVLLLWSMLVFPVSAQAPVGVETTDRAENQFTLSHTKKIMGVGTTATLTTTPYVSAIWISSNPSVVSVNSTTGELTAHKVGAATITALYLYASGETCTRNCQIEVLNNADIYSDDYLIQYKNQDRYLFPEVNDQLVGPHLRILSKKNSIALRWQIMQIGDSYLIKSLAHNMYLGISLNNLSMPTLYSEVNDFTRWRIFESASGFWIAPYLDQYTNGLVLSPNSNQPSNQGYIGLFDYFDKSVDKNWHFNCLRTHLTNYHDYSVENNPTLKSSIDVANELVAKYFDVVLGHTVLTSGYTDYYEGFSVNQCTCGEGTACINSFDCSLHHKNFNRYCDEVSNTPRKWGEKIVVWANHPSSGFYCYKNSNGIHTPKPTIALADAETGGNRIRIFNFAVDEKWNHEASASLILAHEIGHIFNVPEQYDLDPIGHSKDGPMVCVMQAYGYQRAELFYDYIRRNNYENIDYVFCDACWDILVDNVPVS